jgi:hypothetical protein
VDSSGKKLARALSGRGRRRGHCLEHELAGVLPAFGRAARLVAGGVPKLVGGRLDPIVAGELSGCGRFRSTAGALSQNIRNNNHITVPSFILSGHPKRFELLTPKFVVWSARVIETLSIPCDRVSEIFVATNDQFRRPHWGNAHKGLAFSSKESVSVDVGGRRDRPKNLRPFGLAPIRGPRQ